MTAPDCATKDCYGALVATRSHGLFQSSNVIVYDDSHPKWEHKGQVMGIADISYEYGNPKQTQLCRDNSNQVWIRQASQSDDWVKILTSDDILAQLDVQGYGTNFATPHITDIQYISGGRCLVMFGVRDWQDFAPGTGGYFMKSEDYGNNWTITKQLYSTLWEKSAGMGIQRGRNATYGQDTILFAGISDLRFQRAGFVYSKDRGNTWGPVDDEGKLKVLWQGGAFGGLQAPVASRGYINSCYITKDGHLTRLNTWVEGTLVRKDSPHTFGGTSNGDNSLMYHPQKNRAYVVSGGTIWYTWTLEAALPDPLWYSYSFGTLAKFNAVTDYAQNMLYGMTGDWRQVGEHYVWGTDNDFADVFKKSGAQTGISVTDGIFDTESIPINCGGVTREGIAMFLDQAPDEEPENPPTNSGWPIWLTAKATELRRDPSGDRLYVVAETNWPTGSGLWQQPLLFQFILSGTLAGRYYENVGFLAFLPTLTVGGSTIYSGSMNYNGLLEMHTEAPLSHGVVVVGKFDDNKQVYYNDAIHAPLYLYNSGWPVSGWDLVGTFGSKRVTSVAQNYTLLNDMTISHTDMATVSGIATTPWLWDNRIEVPFTVNTQLREGNNVFVGVEGAGESEPIQLATVISGLYSEYPTWVNRGVGLPEVQINRIKRADA